MKVKFFNLALITLTFLISTNSASLSQPSTSSTSTTASSSNSGSSGPKADNIDKGSIVTIRQNYYKRFPAAKQYGPSTLGGSDQIENGASIGPGTINQGSSGPIFTWPFNPLLEMTSGSMASTAAMGGSQVPTLRDTAIQNNLFTTYGYPISDTQFQLIQRYNDNRMLEQMFDPEKVVWAATATGNAQAAAAGNSANSMAFKQAATAINYLGAYLTNFTIASNNRWAAIRNQLFVPIAILLLLPGAVLAQVRAIVASGTTVLGEVNPFEGILRSIFALFMIPGTYLIMNYGIDISNSITYAISSGYSICFGTNMYQDAQLLQLSVDKPAQPANVMTTAAPQVNGQATIENKSFNTAASDILLGMAKGSLSTTWNILCAFQVVYLRYLWCMGPIVAALWVWPINSLRQALPNWIEGVVILCFWSLLWNTSLVVMACFYGYNNYAIQYIVAALLGLTNVVVSFGFNFAGLASDAGMMLASSMNSIKAPAMKNAMGMGAKAAGNNAVAGKGGKTAVVAGGTSSGLTLQQKNMVAASNLMAMQQQMAQANGALNTGNFNPAAGIGMPGGPRIGDMGITMGPDPSYLGQMPQVLSGPGRYAAINLPTAQPMGMPPLSNMQVFSGSGYGYHTGQADLQQLPISPVIASSFAHKGVDINNPHNMLTAVDLNNVSAYYNSSVQQLLADHTVKNTAEAVALLAQTNGSKMFNAYAERMEQNFIATKGDFGRASEMTISSFTPPPLSSANAAIGSQVDIATLASTYSSQYRDLINQGASPQQAVQTLAQSNEGAQFTQYAASVEHNFLSTQNIAMAQSMTDQNMIPPSAQGNPVVAETMAQYQQVSQTFNANLNQLINQEHIPMTQAIEQIAQNSDPNSFAGNYARQVESNFLTTGNLNTAQSMTMQQFEATAATQVYNHSIYAQNADYVPPANQSPQTTAPQTTAPQDNSAQSQDPQLMTQPEQVISHLHQHGAPPQLTPDQALQYNASQIATEFQNQYNVFEAKYQNPEQALAAMANDKSLPPQVVEFAQRVENNMSITNNIQLAEYRAYTELANIQPQSIQNSTADSYQGSNSNGSPSYNNPTEANFGNNNPSTPNLETAIQENLHNQYFNGYKELAQAVSPQEAAYLMQFSQGQPLPDATPQEKQAIQNEERLLAAKNYSQEEIRAIIDAGIRVDQSGNFIAPQANAQEAIFSHYAQEVYTAMQNQNQSLPQAIATADSTLTNLSFSSQPINQESFSQQTQQFNNSVQYFENIGQMDSQLAYTMASYIPENPTPVVYSQEQQTILRDDYGFSDANIVSMQQSGIQLNSDGTLAAPQYSDSTQNQDPNYNQATSQLASVNFDPNLIPNILDNSTGQQTTYSQQDIARLEKQDNLDIAQINKLENVGYQLNSGYVDSTSFDEQNTNYYNDTKQIRNEYAENPNNEQIAQNFAQYATNKPIEYTNQEQELLSNNYSTQQIKTFASMGIPFLNVLKAHQMDKFEGLDDSGEHQDANKAIQDNVNHGNIPSTSDAKKKNKEKDALIKYLENMPSADENNKK